MRKVDPAKHEAKRRHILDAAASCFAKKGFEGTTTADICEKARISSGSLFHYFASKQAIFAAIFEADGRETAARMAEASSSEDPWGEVLAFVDSMVAQAADPEYAGLALAVIEHAKRDEGFGALLMRNQRELHGGLTELLDRAAKRGQIDGSVAPATAATWIINLTDSMFVWTFDPDFALQEQGATLRLILTRFLRAAEDDPSDRMNGRRA